MSNMEEVYIILEEIDYDEGTTTQIEGVYSGYARATVECERLNMSVQDAKIFNYTYTVEDWRWYDESRSDVDV